MDPPANSSLYSMWPLEGLGGRMAAGPSVTSTIVHNSGATVVDTAAVAAVENPLYGFGTLGPRETKQVFRDRMLRRQRAIDEEMSDRINMATQSSSATGTPLPPTPEPGLSDHQSASASGSVLRRKARFAALLVENAQLRDRNCFLVGQLAELNYLRAHNAMLKDSLGKMLQVANIYRGTTSDCNRCQETLRLTDYFLTQGPSATQAIAAASAVAGPDAGGILPSSTSASASKLAVSDPDVCVTPTSSE